jgi:hypothetical protein
MIEAMMAELNVLINNNGTQQNRANNLERNGRIDIDRMS